MCGSTGTTLIFTGRTLLTGVTTTLDGVAGVRVDLTEPWLMMSSAIVLPAGPVTSLMITWKVT